jgi:hypothetical protein
VILPGEAFKVEAREPSLAVCGRRGGVHSFTMKMANSGQRSSQSLHP